MSSAVLFRPHEASQRRQRGLSLIELMVALVLGLLVSVGIVTLFGATGKTNRIQASLARLQENGRYAITRINDDLRMGSGQYCSNTTSTASSINFSANGQQAGVRKPTMWATDFRFPDAGNNTLSGDFSPRYLMQGYECDGTGCTPAIPAAQSPQSTTLPAMGTTKDTRVKGTDVLTVRYEHGQGWSVVDCDKATGTFSAQPKAGDSTATPPVPADPNLAFSTNDLALITDCHQTAIYKVKAVTSGSSNSYAVAKLIPNESAPNVPGCFGNFSSADVRAFNFTKDFVTVTYYLKLKENKNPDAPAGSVIPVLVRRYAYGSSQDMKDKRAVPNVTDPVEDELVEGVERLDFLYGVEANDGTISYLSAKDVDAITSCPSLDTPEAKCGWRSVRSIEVHLLLNTVDSTYGLTTADTSYRYGGNSGVTSTINDGPALGSKMPTTDLPAGSMLRREFVSLISLRNNTP